MIRPDDLRVHVIRPCLTDVGLWSKAVEQLLLGTAATESHLGAYLVQVGGPALGIYQMEPATFEDIHENFLAYRPELRSKVAAWRVGDDPREMVWNLALATIMARLQYLRAPEAIPAEGDIIAMARMYKLRYNTPLGAGSEAGFISAYRSRVEMRIG